MEIIDPVKLSNDVTVVMSSAANESLLKAESGISDINFLLSALLSNMISSSCELLTIKSCLVNSDRSTVQL